MQALVYKISHEKHGSGIIQLDSLAVPPLRLEEEGSGDTHILNPFCRNVINSLARVITCAAYACYHVLLCVWYLCERKNES